MAVEERTSFLDSTTPKTMVFEEVGKGRKQLQFEYNTMLTRVL